MWRLDPGDLVPAWRPRRPAPSAALAFSTRRGGVSEPPFHTLNLGRSTADRPEAVDENRRRLLVSLGLDPLRLATAGQVHGDAVSRVEVPGHTADCDALFTREPGLALAVSAADCVPILFDAPGAVAACHAGWRGMSRGIAARVVHALVGDAGQRAGAIRVHLGPCIRVCCYEVGADVAGRFPPEAVSRVGSSLRLDLVSAARLQLLEAGIPESSVSDTGACTACEPDWYFSHRRDAGRTGRHWGVVALNRA
jgi:YfiH family protein